jgi:hypothetical protein
MVLIVLANAVALAIAWWERWPMLLLLFPYWVQSVVIGWYSGRRILALERFSLQGTSGFTGADDREIKRNTVKFFVLHYGGFHLGYLFFMYISLVTGTIIDDAPPEVTQRDLLWIAAISLMFLFTHRASFHRNLENDRKGCPNIGTVMFLPYLRVVPMHITIISGLALGYTGGVLLFGSLKTLADVLMHWVEHRVLGKEA